MSVVVSSDPPSPGPYVVVMHNTGDTPQKVAGVVVQPGESHEWPGPLVLDGLLHLTSSCKFEVRPA